MTENETILVRIYAKTCAIWSPVRSWGEEIGRNLYFERSRFRTLGLRFISPGSASERKNSELRLQSLERDGLLQITREKERKIFVRLSEAGEAVARSLTAQPSVADSLAVIKGFIGHSAAIDGWVQERVFLGFAKGKDPSETDWRLAVLELLEKLWPSLMREYLESGTTWDGAVFYRLTRNGSNAIKQPIEECNAGKFDDDGPDVFWTSYHDERHRLNADRGDQPAEIGLTPLSF
jgi:DNA-binding MarR family transcriptional regulator